MLIDNVVNEMLKLYNEHRFLPRTEEDVRCLFYHLVLQHGEALSQVHANLPTTQTKGDKKFPDIVIGNPEDMHECDVVELKFVHRSWDSRILTRVRRSIKNLSDLSARECRRKYFIFFNGGRPLSDKEKKLLADSKGRDTIFFLLEEREGKMIKDIL